MLLSAFSVGTMSGQTENVDRQKFPDFSSRLNVDHSLAKPLSDAGQRPVAVNNAATKYFPPVFMQVGGSCGSASRIGYMFTYEINRLRGADASLPENQYPTHFTWLLTNSNSGKEGMAMANGIPNAVTYGGSTYSSLFGIQDCGDPDFGWMQGYDKWYSAMFNRIERNANFPLSVETEEGREAVKNWLWNHNGDPRYPGGGICGIGVASSQMQLARIPSTYSNLDITNRAGAYYVAQWGPQVDHALTIVGYDDRMEFDLDGNGVCGEKDKDEVGAWIIANSWGPTWSYTGFVYCPYKNAVPSAGSTSYYQPEIYYPRVNYRPLRTFKILMEYTRRSEIKLSAGISTNLEAETPEKTIEFEHFKYAGDGSYAKVAPEVPMLGRWADGMLHHEPMEFGYDLTDLTASFDKRQPLKYFFIVERKSGAIGTGKIHSCSLMDYEIDTDGIETFFDMPEDGVEITEDGTRTIISVVVQGEAINKPRNVLTTAEGLLKWDAPALSSYTVKCYNIYCNGELVAQVGKDVFEYATPQPGSYQVAAVYENKGLEFISERVASAAIAYYGVKPETANIVRQITNGGLRVKDLFKEHYDQATIEYWIKPKNVTANMQHIGPGWGKFSIRGTATRGLHAGWTDTDAIIAGKNTFPASRWSHVAVVVDANRLIAYVNGVKVGDITSSNNSGIGGFGDFDFGAAGTNGISGEFDEVRVWSVARSQREIQSMMYTEVADPANTPGLLLELRMNETAKENPTDATGLHTVEQLIYNGTGQMQLGASQPMTDTRTLAADFVLPGGVYYTHTPIEIQNTSSGNAVRFEWQNSDTPGQVSAAENASLVFTAPGEKTLTLTAYDAAGNSAVKTQTFTVEAIVVPQPSFTLPASVPADKRFTIKNTSTPLEGCAYEWIMTGSENETAHTLHATTRYKKAGKYTITLKATNAAGTVTCSKDIQVLEKAPEVDFTISAGTVLKGATVQLTDASAHVPSSWYWTVSDAAHHNVYSEQNPTLTLNAPGVYAISLTATNAIGSGVKTNKRGLIVCNADGKSGLNFTGSESVAFNTPVDLSVSNAFTIDWWMYPKNNQDPSHHIGGSSSDFAMTVLSNGTLSVSLGGKVFNTEPGVITPMEWHHYATVFVPGKDPNYGLDRVSVNVYKDCHLVTVLNIPGVMPTMPAKMSLSSSAAPMNAVIDEFRVWNTALTQDQLTAYANQPVEDVAAAMANDKLALYYAFNQTGGDVQDVTGNANHGTRIGFGPDGDAWTPSLGVFCLSNVRRTDLSARYLTNYAAPFLNNGETINAAAPQYLGLLQDETTSRWIIENVVESGNVLTGVSVDTEMEDMMVIATKIKDFAGEVNDHKVYQTVTLPAGYYVFGAEGVEVYSENMDYIVVAQSGKFPNTDELRYKPLAYTLLSNGEVAFSLSAETEVSLGLLLNTRGESTQHIRRFYLEQKITNDDFVGTGIDAPLAGNASGVKVVPGVGGISVSSATPATVSVYAVSGVNVVNAKVFGTSFITLPAGIYIVNGEKCLVR